MKEFDVKVIINKKNNQFNIPLPKKKLSPETIKDIKNNKLVKIKI